MKYNIFLLLVFYYPIILFSQQNQSTGNKGVKDGFGVLEYKGHGVYRGNFVNSKIEGYGEYFFDNGDVIKGNKKNGLYEGVVTYYFSNGEVKTANYIEGKEVSVISYPNASEKKVGCVSGDCQNGIGKYILNNGEYEGSFLYGKQSGQGKFTCPNGDRYEGQYSDGNKNGYGILSQANGKKYEGNYKNGQKSGIGTFYDLDGSKYIGNWTEGQMNGMGEFYYSDGSYYVGEFVNGSRTGNGKVVLADGKIQEGLFEEGIYKGVSTSNTVTQNTIVSPPPVDKNQVSVVKTQVDPRFTTNLKSVVIGTQTWTTENLNISTFRNGDPIPEAKTDEEWEMSGPQKNEQPAWCYYNNDPVNGAKYGKIYNWIAVNDPRGLAPLGWHVPDEKEWIILMNYLGGAEGAGNKLKSNKGWHNYTTGGSKVCPNCAAWNSEYRRKVPCHTCKDTRTIPSPIITHSGNGSNSSGFGALPFPGRSNYGSFDILTGTSTSFWSTTEASSSLSSKPNVLTFLVADYHDFLVKNSFKKNDGIYVRLIKD